MRIDIHSIQSIQAALSKGEGKTDPQRLKKACQLFEALFLSELFKEMRKTIPKGELLKEHNSDRIYKSMLDEEYATRMAEEGGVGLGDLLFKQLSNRINDGEKHIFSLAEMKKGIEKKD